MRYNDIRSHQTNVIGNEIIQITDNLLIRDRLVRIANIVTVLGFAETEEQFAIRFLDLSKREFSDFVSGKVPFLKTHVKDTLARKLQICANTIADEKESCETIGQHWMQHCRASLIEQAEYHSEKISDGFAE